MRNFITWFLQSLGYSSFVDPVSDVITGTTEQTQRALDDYTTFTREQFDRYMRNNLIVSSSLSRLLSTVRITCFGKSENIKSRAIIYSFVYYSAGKLFVSEFQDGYLLPPRELADEWSIKELKEIELLRKNGYTFIIPDHTDWN
jgi:hypothetical protein